MSVMAAMVGARLAFVVRELEGEVERPVSTWKKGEGVTQVMRKEPAGFIVYFPRGHILRFKTKKELAHYNLDKKPKLMNMEGLYDPNSPLGQMFTSQSEEARQEAYVNLEEQVIALATAKTGPIVLPEQMKRAQPTKQTRRAA